MTAVGKRRGEELKQYWKTTQEKAGKRRESQRKRDLSMGHDAQADADAAAVRLHRITSDLQSRLQTATNANENQDQKIEKKGETGRWGRPQDQKRFSFVPGQVYFS